MNSDIEWKENFGIDPIISGGAIHRHQNTLQCVEEEVFLQINKSNDPSCIFLGGTSLFHQNILEGKASVFE